MTAEAQYARINAVRKINTRASDGRVHFSDLKEMAKSPAHYLYSVNAPETEPTPAMRLGALVDALVFPGTHDYVVWEGSEKRKAEGKPPLRAGNEWETFKKRYAAFEIYDLDELETAKNIADALSRDRAASDYLTGEPQVALEWDAFGLPFVTRGVDVVGWNLISDLKVTNSTEPRRFARHARERLWPQQITLYQTAKLEWADYELAIVGVEATPPHCCTVLVLTPAMIERARKSLVLWTDRLRACEVSDHFPGYTEVPVPCDVDEWEKGDDDEL